MNEAGLDQEELPQPAPAQRFGFALLSNSPSSEVFLPHSNQRSNGRAAAVLYLVFIQFVASLLVSSGTVTGSWLHAVLYLLPP